MSGSTRSSSDLDVRRRKILFRAWHRGIREMDIVLGQFADAHIASLNDDEMREFEIVLEINDRDLLQWITGERPTPPDVDTPFFRRLSKYGKIQ